MDPHPAPLAWVPDLRVEGLEGDVPKEAHAEGGFRFVFLLALLLLLFLFFRRGTLG